MSGRGYEIENNNLRTRLAAKELELKEARRKIEHLRWLLSRAERSGR